MRRSTKLLWKCTCQKGFISVIHFHSVKKFLSLTYTSVSMCKTYFCHEVLFFFVVFF